MAGNGYDGGYQHVIPPILTADTLFEKYIRRISNTDPTSLQGFNDVADAKPSNVNNGPAPDYFSAFKDKDISGQNLNSLISSLPDDRQFFMIGDTNHECPKIREFIFKNFDYLDSLKEKGFKHIVLEYPDAYEGPAKAYINHEIGRDEARNLIAEIFSYHCPGLAKYALDEGDEMIRLADAYTKAGLEFHFLDQHLFEGEENNENNLHDRIGDHERMLAAKIQERVGADKTAIIYGAAHFKYSFSMRGLLGADKCTVVNLYGSEEDYNTIELSRRSNCTYQPDCIHAIDENKVIIPRKDYGRECPPFEDLFIIDYHESEQAIEIGKFRAMRFRYEQECKQNGIGVSLSASDFLDEVKPYWHETWVKKILSSSQLTPHPP